LTIRRFSSGDRQEFLLCEVIQKYLSFFARQELEKNLDRLQQDMRVSFSRSALAKKSRPDQRPQLIQLR